MLCIRAIAIFARCYGTHTLKIHTHAWCQTRIQIDDGGYFRCGEANHMQAFREQQPELLQHWEDA